MMVNVGRKNFHFHAYFLTSMRASIPQKVNFKFCRRLKISEAMIGKGLSSDLRGRVSNT